MYLVYSGLVVQGQYFKGMQSGLSINSAYFIAFQQFHLRADTQLNALQGCANEACYKLFIMFVFTSYLNSKCSLCIVRSPGRATHTRQ